MSENARETMFLRPSEAAGLVGLSTRAIYRAVQRGELGAVRLCSRLRIPRAAFDEWVERGRVQSIQPATSPAAGPPTHPAGSFRRLLAAAPDRSVSR